MLVLDDLVADTDESGIGIDDAGRVVAPGLQGRGDDEGLDARARLDDVGGGAVAVHRRADLAAIVGIEGRLVDHGEDLAGGHIEHDHRSGTRAVVADRRLQFPIRQVLDAHVDAQRQVPAGARGADVLDVLHLAALAVLDDALEPVLSGQPVIEGQLGAFLPLVIDAGEAQHMAHHFAGRVVAVVFAHQVHARQVQLADRLGVLRIQMPRQPEEVTILAAGNAARQVRAIAIQDLGKILPAFGGSSQFPGIGPHGVHRRADRQRRSVTVENPAAVCNRRDFAHEPRITLADEKAAIRQLQVHCPCHQRSGRQRQQRRARSLPAGESPSRRTVPRASRLHDLDPRRIRNGHLQPRGGDRARRRHASTRNSARAAAGPTRCRGCRAGDAATPARRTAHGLDDGCRWRRWPTAARRTTAP